MVNNAPDGLTLIVIFDGLRPDFVRPDWTPTLWALRQRGVWASHSHCVFPSVTRANAATLVTGCFPGRHGIESNTLWRPAVDSTRPLRTSDRADLLRLEAAQGRLLSPPTLGEVLAAAGERLVAVGTGSAGAASLLHPHAGDTDGVVLHYTFGVPEEAASGVAESIGPWPEAGPDLQGPDLAVKRVAYGMQALGTALLPSVRPRVAIFWCTVPDGPHHQFGIGHPASVAALRAADAEFVRLLAKARSLYKAVNLIVTADHGYITVTERVDVAGLLIEAGLKQSRESADVVLGTDGGVCLLYLEDATAAAPIARLLNRQPWTAALLSPSGIVPGTLPLEATGGGRRPELLLCLTSDDTANEHGIAGGGVVGGSIPVGAGDHGGGSRWELHNLLLLEGPTFRQGVETETPCGIVDIAPTVLHLLGLQAPETWQGRVLTETLRAGGPAPTATTETVLASAGPGGDRPPSRLTVARAGSVRYACAVERLVR